MKNSTSDPKQTLLSSLSQLETKLDLYFNKKAPALPAGAKDFIVMVSPYGAILGIVFAIPAVLALLGLSAVFAPMMMLAGGWGFRGIVSLAALVITTILYALAVPGLFKRRKEAWDKLFWISLVNIVSAAISMNLFNMVLGALISWYFLFQVRSYYK